MKKRNGKQKTRGLLGWNAKREPIYRPANPAHDAAAMRAVVEAKQNRRRRAT